MIARENLKLVIVAAVCLGAGLAAPAVAATVADYAKNADKVDGKHAVSATAKISARKGKLVATSGTTGRLPDNIIAKAPDANLLDGKDSSAFAPAGAGLALASGQTARGVFYILDPHTEVVSGEYTKYATGVVSWPALSEAPTAHWMDAGATPTTECPGSASNPAAAAGHACFYVGFGPHTDAAHTHFSDPTTIAAADTTSRFGVRIESQNKDTTNLLEVQGSWAVTAP